jgi:hypothetical protein
MKNLFLLCVLLFSGIVQGQRAMTLQEYVLEKSAGRLNPHESYTIVPSPSSSNPAQRSNRIVSPMRTTSSVCNCMIPLDTATFQVVPFTIGVPPDYRNDDGSSPAIQLPFVFNFFGTPVNSIYINTNGNISFGSPYSTFTASSFPDSTYIMIAPFWADVDTRGTGSGLVYYELTSTHLVVRWDTVGYYASLFDKKNDFQLIITDGTDSILPVGTNVSFCYGDMQWTTGNASQGVNGFGGIPSTVGVNRGNGTDFFQVTRNDASGSTFDGPYGNNDGVDWLDDMSIYFNTAISGNTPPLVMNNTICDTIDVFTGDTLRTVNNDSVSFMMYFMTPEPNQTLTDTIWSNAPAANFHYTLIDSTGSYHAYRCTFIANHLLPGVYTVTGYAQDNGTPAASSYGYVYIHTYFDPTLTEVGDMISNDFKLYPNPAAEQLSIDRASNTTAEVFVLNSIGQQLLQKQMTGTHLEIDLTGLAPGFYYLTVKTENGASRTEKFIRR